MSLELRPEITSLARALEIELAAVVDLSSKEVVAEIEKQFEAYKAWIDAKAFASMMYMLDNMEPRADAERILQGARTALVCLVPYATGSRTRHSKRDRAAPPTDSILNFTARYAHGRDYHRVIKKRLTQFSQKLETLLNGNCTARVIVDTAPFLERAYGGNSGIGFQGKNTMLIRPGLGSYFFIATILLTVDASDVAVEKPQKNPIQTLNCGDCRRCLDACPTQALSKEYFLDAGRCLSYLTIEHRGTVDDHFVKHFAEHIYGCDVCQEACPYNFSTLDLVTFRELEFTESHPLARVSALDVALMHQGQYEQWFGGSAMTRAKYEGLVRNAIYHLYAKGDASLNKVLELRANDENDVIRDAVCQVGKLIAAKS